MKKGFTIVELLVAMALLAILIAISGMVFSTAVKAYRTAGASTEIASRLSTVTDRLNRDFQSLPAGAPIAVWFEYSGGRRYDQIQFFSAGDTFQSAKQWPYMNVSGTTSQETLWGNTARIYYGHANNVRIDNSTNSRSSYRPYNFSSYTTPVEQAKESILSRRVHILEVVNAAHSITGLFPATITYSGTKPVTVDYSSGVFISRFVPWSTASLYGNDVFEYDNISLSEWMNILSVSANVNQYLRTSFAKPDTSSMDPIWKIGGRPGVDLTATDGQSLHMIMTQGVGSFSIQLAYTALDVADSTGIQPTFTDIRWWPSTDPDGNPTTADSDFGSSGMNASSFGSCIQFNLLDTELPTNWWKWNKMTGDTNTYLGPSSGPWWFVSDYFPKAIKFTFTLYDSNGVFRDGKTFTHIVNLK